MGVNNRGPRNKPVHDGQKDEDVEDSTNGDGGSHRLASQAVANRSRSFNRPPSSSVPGGTSGQFHMARDQRIHVTRLKALRGDALSIVKLTHSRTVRRKWTKHAAHIDELIKLLGDNNEL